MIIFCHNKELVENLAGYCSSYRIINLSSRYKCDIDISNLMTTIENINPGIMRVDAFVYSVEFDMIFASAIENNTQMFISLMNIMIPHHNGENVFIMVDRDKYRDAVLESLIKYIQQKYGVRSYIVEEADDAESIEDSNFTPEGLIAMDKDIEKFNDLRSKGIATPILNEISYENGGNDANFCSR